MIGIRELSFERFNVPLNEPFGIATGAQHRAENVLVRVVLEDGTVGLGEAAPVPHISGESQDDVLRVLSEAGDVFRGVDLADYRKTCARVSEAVGSVPSALAGTEIALFDALCRRQGISLRAFFGGALSTVTIDVTITTGSVEHASASAARFAQRGFSLLKVKIGGTDIGQDVERLLAILRSAPGAGLILDGNTAFSAQTALELLSELGPLKSRVVLFEQPTAAQDLDGLAEVQHKSGIRVAADESLRSRADFERIVRSGGISVVNLKTAKLGVLAAWDLLIAARAVGLGVMIGGMVETEISMTTSACLAAGVGGVEFIDLDTPLFLGDRPTKGEVTPWGPLLDLSRIRAGHGVRIEPLGEVSP